jgi:ubiquitin-protein ligase
MTPRERRLLSDMREMEDLARAGEFTFRADGSPPTLYRVLFHVPGLALDGDGRLVLRGLHRCDVYLHLDYPRRPPVVTWQTPVFHPNLTRPERNGGVCIGSWSAAERLTDLCLRLRDMVAYRVLNADDALDLDASAWVRFHGISPGADVGDLVHLPLPPDPRLVVGRSE